jgi:hypothetical protein
MRHLLYLVPTDLSSTLLIEGGLLKHSKYYGIEKYSDQNFRHTNRHILIWVDMDGKEPIAGDLVYDLAKTKIGILPSEKDYTFSDHCKKIIASSSDELTPNSLISDFDLKNIVEYYNKKRELPKGYLKMVADVLYENGSNFEDALYNLKIVNNEVSTKWKDIPNDLFEWISKEGLPSTKEILKELKEIRLSGVVKKGAEKHLETYKGYSDDTRLTISDFTAGAKSDAAKEYHTEGMYSAEEVIELLQKYRYDLSSGKTPNIGDTTKEWFNQFKK